MIFKIYTAFKWHRLISWLGGLAIITFGISGILHPLMSWTGPQASQFRAPSATFTSQDFFQAKSILKKFKIEEAYAVQLVPGPSGNLLQLTENTSKPRRYFDLINQNEIPDFDSKYATWLARYYTGFKSETIDSIVFQADFDNAYPSVNRLLPVYKINFSNDEKSSVYIYTELSALTGITNTYKTRLQTLFRWMHTLSWLGDTSLLRFIVMLILVGSVLAMVITGASLVFGFKRKKRTRTQKWHRYVGFVIWVPLAFFSVSGTYHLIYNELSDSQQALIAAPAFPIRNLANDFEVIQSDTFKSVSLIQKESLLFRLNTLPQDQEVTRNSRFKGMQSEGKPVYINAETGQVEVIKEQELASFYAALHAKESVSNITNIEKITSFGSGYDFRNKRLPVWKIEFKSGKMLFIDNRSGLLVDQTTWSAGLESLSFSFLHKYSFLTPFTGRFYRDVIMVIILLFAIGMSITGYCMLLKKKK